MLISGYEIELLFGSREVLASAGSLVRLDGVAVSPRKEITYIHVMFDQHEVIYANGAATESFFAADHMITTLSQQNRHDMFDRFPHLRGNLEAYGRAARTCLKGFETALLRSLGSHDALVRAA